MVSFHKPHLVNRRLSLLLKKFGVFGHGKGFAFAGGIWLGEK